VSQFKECNLCMTELGNKFRLLTSCVREDERADEAETLVWESLNLLQDDVDQWKEEAMLVWEGLEKF
jgi:hypothetical protein